MNIFIRSYIKKEIKDNYNNCFFNNIYDFINKYFILLYFNKIIKININRFIKEKPKIMELDILKKLS